MRERRTALVTGAGRGIGRAIALALAGEGFDIVANDIRHDARDPGDDLLRTASRVEAAGAECLAVQADISSLAEQDRLLDETFRRFGRLDVLVNNAGVAPISRRDVLDTLPESYDRLMSINARGAFFLTQNAARRLLKSGPSAGGPSPCLIFITSISAEVSSPSRPEYCISKAAMSMTARLFADRLAGHGIDVFEIRPGLVRTAMTEPVRDTYDRRIENGLVPQGRWGSPEDIGRAVASLARGDWSYATGLVLELSGGMNIRRL